VRRRDLVGLTEELGELVSGCTCCDGCAEGLPCEDDEGPSEARVRRVRFARASRPSARRASTSQTRHSHL